MNDLFIPIVPENKLHPSFKNVAFSLGYEPARHMANEIFKDFKDKDGNFLEQFQTSGFDSRIFELYLYAYFKNSEYALNEENSSPDFIVSRNDITVAIEATTVNPTQSQDIEPESDNKSESELSEKEFQEKILNELPIKLGSPLFSKLNKRYWELEQCKNIPIVLAIEAFHEKESLSYSSSALAHYLYGLRSFPKWTESGEMIIEGETIEKHSHKGKIIPSNFFNQPNAEHISAILFSNSGTITKFLRMGYQAGFHRGNLKINRIGSCYNPDPNSATPLEFKYNMDFTPFYETWGQGLDILHNPNAKNPIPLDYFRHSNQLYLKKGIIANMTPEYHPFMSKTLIGIQDDDEFVRLINQEEEIHSILQSEFEEFNPPRGPMHNSVFFEKEWYINRNNTIIGTITYDSQDNDWGYAILGPDQNGSFRFIDGETGLESMLEVRSMLVDSMIKITKTGQTIFPQ